jgi:hypothetical protein
VPREGGPGVRGAGAEEPELGGEDVVESPALVKWGVDLMLCGQRPGCQHSGHRGGQIRMSQIRSRLRYE